MPVTNIHTLNTSIRGFSVGSTRTDFLSDGLGSVTQEINSLCQSNSSQRFTPYGNLVWRTGDDASSFGWVGNLGYRSTGLAGSEYYVRSRHYSSTTGNWTSVDKLWPRELPFGYVLGNPTTYTDSTGYKCDCRVIQKSTHFARFNCAKVGGLWNTIYSWSPAPTGNPGPDPCKRCPNSGHCGGATCRPICKGTRLIEVTLTQTIHAGSLTSTLSKDCLKSDDNNCPGDVNIFNIIVQMLKEIGVPLPFLDYIKDTLPQIGGGGCPGRSEWELNGIVTEFIFNKKRYKCPNWQFYQSFRQDYVCCDCGRDIYSVGPLGVMTYTQCHPEYAEVT